MVRRRASVPAWIVVGVAALVVVGVARAADDDGDPWVDGPEAPAPDDPLDERASPPREPGAPPWDIVVPEPAPLPALPVVADELSVVDDPRLTTTLDRARLHGAGDLRLADALVPVPGLFLAEDAAFGAHPLARGLDETHTAILIDGIPVLPAFVFPSFPTLTFVGLDELEAARFQHGPRVGLGREGAAGGVLELQTVPMTRDLGEEFPIVGELRGGMGGADVEKLVSARGDVGLGRARVGVAVHGFHAEDRRLGRGDGLYRASDGWGGALAARGDILVDRRTRVLGFVRSARQARTPLPARCTPDVEGRFPDCLTLHDRALDLLGAGVDVTRGLGPVRVDGTARAHAQRVSEEWERAGIFRPAFERTKDELWRGGALGSLTLSLPDVDAGAASLTPFVTLGGELGRDRATSSYAVRSIRLVDASPDELQEVPSVSPLVDGDRGFAKGLVALGVRHRRAHAILTVDGGAQVLTIARHDARLERGLPSRDVAPFVDGELSLGWRFTDDARVFAALTRVDRPESLFDRTRGRLLMPDGAVPLPMRPGHGRFTEHGGELGLAFTTFGLVTVEAVGFASARSGAVGVGVDETESLARGADVTRVVRGPRRFVTGVEGRAVVTPPLDGVRLEGTLGAVAVDEGLFFRTTDPFTPVPARGVLRPGGMVEARYAPTSWPLSVFARTRYALPLARLAPEEEDDPVLCPESTLAAPTPCFGVTGFALVDVGGRVTIGEHIDVDATALNLLDQSHQLRASTLPGRGIGARLAMTLRF